MTPGELLKAGKLNEAIAAALDGVKSHPTDTARRGLLAELLCQNGELERADKQLEVLIQQSPELALGLALIRQLIRGETARTDFFKAGRVPEFLGEPSDDLKLHLQASIALREGNVAEASRLLAEAEEARVKVSGTCDGQAFDDFRDLDDSLSSFFEVLTSTGKYYWIPIDRVESIEFHAPERPKDLIWRRASMDVNDGPEGEVFLPVLYPYTSPTATEQHRLGRATDWLGDEGEAVRGVGQRMFLVGDDALPIMQLKMIEFKR